MATASRVSVAAPGRLPWSRRGVAAALAVAALFAAGLLLALALREDPKAAPGGVEAPLAGAAQAPLGRFAPLGPVPALPRAHRQPKATASTPASAPSAPSAPAAAPSTSTSTPTATPKPLPPPRRTVTVISPPQ